MISYKKIEKHLFSNWPDLIEEYGNNMAWILDTAADTFLSLWRGMCRGMKGLVLVNSLCLDLWSQGLHRSRHPVLLFTSQCRFQLMQQLWHWTNLHCADLACNLFRSLRWHHRVSRPLSSMTLACSSSQQRPAQVTTECGEESPSAASLCSNAHGEHTAGRKTTPAHTAGPIQS